MNKEQVHALWIGDKKLTNMQLLTLHSFSSMGAEFNLWSYEEIDTKNIKNVKLKDANKIISKKEIFKYPSEMLLGFGENSFVGFSEIFRYKVLYELGGWWSDMDVVCLKPLSEIKDDYWFRFHGVLSIVGNIMKCPPKSKLMKLCYEKALKEIDSKQNDWHHAIRILCYYVEFLELNKFIHKYKCNLDRLPQVYPLMCDNNFKLPKSWCFIHWMNSVIPKKFVDDSIMCNLLKKYNLLNKKFI